LRENGRTGRSETEEERMGRIGDGAIREREAVGEKKYSREGMREREKGRERDRRF
jgi:hypothetical protein